MAACDTTVSGGNSTVICDSTHQGDTGTNITTTTGADKVEVTSGNTGDIKTGDNSDRILIDTDGTVKSVQGQDGNDILVLKNGTITGNFNADGGDPGRNDITSSTVLKSGADRIFMFGGSVGGEVQNGPNPDGTRDFMFLLGGTVNGTAEMQRGTHDAVMVIDGATVLGGIEMQSGNVAVNGQLSDDPTFYLRSGFVGAGNWGAANDSTFIIDPVNSQNKSYYEPVADDALESTDNYPDSDTLQGMIDNTTHPNASGHMLTIGEGAEDDDGDGGGEEETPTIGFGAGADKLTFIGAVNYGEGTHNLHFGDVDEPDEEEIPNFDGGGNDGDVLTVTGQSSLMLAGVKGFQDLTVGGGSTLVLNAAGEYEFEETITVKDSSVLWITSAGELESKHISIEGPTGDALLKIDQYAAFDPGSILKFGALPGSDEDDGDGEDGDGDDLQAAEAEEGDGTVHVEVKVGSHTLVSAGTLLTANGIVGDEVEVSGGLYEAHNAKMAIDTVLSGTDSETDKFEFKDGATGTTTIYVSNVGGTGAFTGHGAENGILIVEADGGTFQLGVNETGRREVIGGAFSYQAVRNDDEVRLQSDILDQVPAYAAASSVAQRWSSSGLGTLYKRLGEVRLGQANDRELSGGGTVWARGLYGDYDVSPSSGFNFSQQNDGVLMGADAVLKNDGGRLVMGLFGGYGTANSDVSATIWGANSTSKVDLTAWSIGGYGTYYENGRPGTGLYVDGVFKIDILDFDMAAVSRAASASTDGYATTVSGETGYGFSLGGNLTLQPQAQLSYTNVSVTNYTDTYGLDVGNGNSESLVGRASLQVQGNYGSSSNLFAPYVIASVLSDFFGDNTTTIANTPFTSDMGFTWFEAGGGVTAQLGQSLSIYGSAEYSFGDIEGWGGTGGVKARW